VDIATSTKVTEQKNAPELPIGRFLKSKSLGGNRVIFTVRLEIFDGYTRRNHQSFKAIRG
jgi:hypothetical protein